MIQQFVYEFAVYAIEILDFLCIATVLLGAVKCVVLTAKNKFNFLKKEPLLIFANALSVAMGFKLGSEIIKLIIVKNWDEILILGALVAIKVVLTLLIHMEIKNAQDHDDKHQKGLDKKLAKANNTAPGENTEIE